jgi:hypothetical protein
VVWPDPLKVDGAFDMGAPIASLLIDIGALPKKTDVVTGSGNEVPASLAIIEAGATEFSKKQAAFVKWAGGVFAVGGTVLSFVTAFWKSAGEGVRAVTIGGTLLVVVAVVIGVSVIVSSDVRARGTGALGQYHARAQVADAYLHGAVSVVASSARSATAETAIGLMLGAFSQNGVLLKLRNGEKHSTHGGVQLNGMTGDLEVDCGEGNWRPISEVVEFHPLGPPQAA